VRRNKKDRINKIKLDWLQIWTVKTFLLPDPVYPVQKFSALI